ncbi:MAG: NTP transferase domain-containing protein [Candidatus Tectomicrobia bacterium]|uniref:NTP transferase domain-containing protein n=1 Tax=Tectimicrobiota bacterium TaxID=2528274 RepID=A0A932CL75_UNCTE|nr:NTP transferase domain-containing protein [Candidatus Tectomicrobia bacterium]
MRTVILAAGSGENLYPFNTTRPKSMLYVSGYYLLDQTLTLLRNVGLSDISLIVGHCKEKILNHFGRGHDLDLSLSYFHQEEPRGIGDALLLARERVSPNEYFLLVYGDILTLGNIFSKTLQTFNLSKGPVAAICLPPSSELFGNVYLDEEMRITRIVEKPQSSGLGNYVLAGVFVLPGSFFKLLEEEGANMARALEKLVQREVLQASIWEGEWIDIGFPWDILTANELIMNSWQEAVIDRSVQFRGSVRVEGPVHIQEGVVIESGTTLRGPCYIGANSYIGHNVLVRKYASLGPGTQVGFGVELKNCVLFGHSKVGRLSFLGDSVIGEGVYLGAGIVTVNGNLDGSSVQVRLSGQNRNTGLEKLGAFIGDGARIGAGHTLSAGTVIRAEETLPPNYSFFAS